jgi:hypothetical protein
MACRLLYDPIDPCCARTAVERTHQRGSFRPSRLVWLALGFGLHDSHCSTHASAMPEFGKEHTVVFDQISWPHGMSLLLHALVEWRLAVHV